jgi:hypothetical protein
MKPEFLSDTRLSALLIASTLVMVSCSKNNSGKPPLKLESINTTVQVNDSMRARSNSPAAPPSSNGTFWSIRTASTSCPLPIPPARTPSSLNPFFFGQ